MKVRKTSDYLYPIVIEDSWDQKLFIHRWTLEDTEKWNAFVKLLEDIRSEILKGSEGVTDE